MIKKSLCTWWRTVIIRCTETFWSPYIILQFTPRSSRRSLRFPRQNSVYFYSSPCVPRAFPIPSAWWDDEETVSSWSFQPKLFAFQPKLLFVLFSVLFVCKYVLYYCHRVATQLQLTNMSYHITELSSCHVQPFRLKCLPQHLVLEHAQPMAYPLLRDLPSHSKAFFFKAKDLCKSL